MVSLKWIPLVKVLSISVLWMASACTLIPLQDTTSPMIQDVKTSSKVLVKSDCMSTTLTVTAKITDNNRIESATLWYRVGADQKFASTNMKLDSGDLYNATIVGLEIPGGEYGVLEFYIVAEDQAGNQSKSPVDESVQMLPCVAN